jgi:hypothetical protein
MSPACRMLANPELDGQHSHNTTRYTKPQQHIHLLNKTDRYLDKGSVRMH